MSITSALQKAGLKAMTVETTINDHGIGSWPMRRARMTPNKIALVDEQESLTYVELAHRVDALTMLFRSLGVGRGDRVAYLGFNDISTFECLFASGRRGAIFVPLNTRLAAPEIGYMLRDSGARLLVYGPAFAELIEAIDPLSAGGAHAISIEQLREMTDNLHEEIGSGRRNESTTVSLDDPAIILYTSGTTGRPKGAILTHGNVTWNTMNQLAHFDLASTDVSICAAPLFHVTGLGQVTMPMFFKGGTVVVVPQFDPGSFLALIRSSRVTSFAAVPTMLQMLTEHEDWATSDLSSLSFVIYGGSPISAHVAKAWLDRGISIQQGYGLTEASPGIFMAIQEGAQAHPVSCGVPHFFTDTAIEIENGVVLHGPGQGELLVRGPNVFDGYWDRPSDTAASMTDDGWFRTGDVLRVGEDGWAHVVDRVKDLIISGGENIYPAEVEAVIVEIAGVRLAAVVGVDDDKWGEVGHAFVMTDPDSDVDSAAIRSHLEERLARYKIPRYIELVRELPRNAAGKILRTPLRELARNTHSANATKDNS